MAEETTPLESMSCEELLRLMASLTARRDRDTAAVMGDDATGATEKTLADEGDQLSRVTELLKAKGCDGAQ
ncbi:MAG TPA: hypothetical protein VFS21_16460 [Roseiflexaceae bacterium]|nr:hypothetical protein [Roseiflexaceae bacterium]